MMRSLSAWIVLLGLLAFAPSARANCADTVSELDEAKPAIERLWARLQQQTEYSWGKARPYGTLEGNRITLTPAFDRLTGSQKREALKLLQLDGWPTELLTPEEQATIRAKYGGFIPAAQSPYEVYDSVGRAISLPYDGCTRFVLLTESARFSWYYNRGAYHNLDRSKLRNAGTPEWRLVRVPISPRAETTTRLTFWKTMGYQFGGWIAWVPELGHFEIEVRTTQNPVGQQLRKLEKFWRVAPAGYRYVVVDSDGVTLQTRKF